MELGRDGFALEREGLRANAVKLEVAERLAGLQQEEVLDPFGGSYVTGEVAACLDQK